MDLLEEIIKILYRHIHDPKTLEKARLSDHAFTRSRKLPFHLCLIFGLAHFMGSLAYGLEEFFAEELELDTVITSSAYSHARAHFDCSPYQDEFYLVRNAVDEYYRNHGKLKTMYGLQILAIDGSLVALPDRRELLKEFGGTGRGACSPTARMTLIYDSLNEIIYEATMTPIRVGERRQALELIGRLSSYLDLSQAALIFDRGYASEELIKFLDSLSARYIFRVRRNFNRSIQYAPLGDSPLWVGDGLKRLVRLRLDGETNEYLLTNLFDVPTGAFKELYFLRWPIEVEYDTIKNKIEMPNFNATLENGIYQDFWISMVLGELVGVIGLAADEIIQSRSRRGKKKYSYQSNTSEIVNALHVDLARILVADSEEKRKERLERLMAYASKNEEPIRPNRCFPRNLIRNVRYHYNRKSH